MTARSHVRVAVGEIRRRGALNAARRPKCSRRRYNCAAMFHLVIFEPEIPPNTGNLIRLAANTGCELHLVKPLGFRLDRKSVRRAGLDYDELATVHLHENFAAARAALTGNWFAIETGAPRRHVDVKFVAGRCAAVRLGTARTAGRSAGRDRPAQPGVAADARGQPQPEPVECRGDRGLRGVAPGRVRRRGLN